MATRTTRHSVPNESVTGTLVSSLSAWFQTSARDMPWRHTLDPYAIWISEVMLQQTQVATVIPYWERWMQAFPDAATLAAAPEDRVLKLWEGLGYYTRARNLQKAAQLIVGQHQGRFPADYESVLALPGIGRYTAGAICSIARNLPAPILDGNVIRVLSRFWGVEGDARDKTVNQQLWALAEAAVRRAGGQEEEAEQTLAARWRAPFPVSGACSVLNQSLMELGALICTPHQPKCPACPIRTHCRALATHRVAELPLRSRRASVTARSFIAFCIEDRGKWLVQQRPEQSVNARLWEFPAFEISGPGLPVNELFKRQFRIGAELTPLPLIRHSITRYRITLAAFRAALKRGARRMGAQPGLVWRTAREVDELALTSAHRKIWNQLR